jgi:HSP90 family molecular chaperone
MDDLVFLIEQVSTKERKTKDNDPKTTGKFGTGFITTHLLSTKVDVEGVYHNIKENTYQKFNLLLDR